MKVPLFRIYWDDSDVRAVAEVIRRGSYWSSGDKVPEFERAISDYLGVKHTVTFNSGGAALHAAMLAHGFKEGDEVLVPAFTFIATAYAPLYVGAKPDFADIEDRTFCLDPEDVVEKITPKTKAIIPIHYGGMPGRTIKALREIAHDNGLALIEDSAESFGAKIDDSFVGGFGDLGMFSLCQNKVFTTGEGGFLVTDNTKLKEKLELVRSYGRKMKGNYFDSSNPVDYVQLGYNWRMPEMLAALGISQLKKVDKIIEMRRRNAHYLNNKLSGIESFIVPREPKKSFSVYQMYTVRVLEGRDKLAAHLAKKGIFSKVYFDPLTDYTVLKNLKQRKLETTEAVSTQVLTLPMFPTMTRIELNYIVDAVKEFFEN